VLKAIIVKIKNVWLSPGATLRAKSIIAEREKQKVVPMIAKKIYNGVVFKPLRK